MPKRSLEKWDEIFKELTAEEDWQTLLEEASQCIKEWPDEFAGYAVSGDANYSLGRYEEAITDYDKAISLKPDDAAAYGNRGFAKDELGRYEEAITDYDKAISLKSDDATAYYNRGSAKSELGRHEEAITDYDKAISLKSDYATAYNNRGSTKLKLGHYEEAITDYDRAIELEPDNVIYHSGRALAFASISAAKTRESLEREYKRQLEDVQSISTITKNFREDIKNLEYLLYGDPPSGGGSGSGQPPSGGGSGSGDPPSGGGSGSHNDQHPKQKHIGWIKQAEEASGRARWYLIFIVILTYVGFFFLHKVPDQCAMGDISFLDILQLNAFVLLLYSPFLFFNKHLSDRVNRSITLLHAIKRDRDRLSFWAAQANDDESTKKSRLAPAVLKHLQTNSAADISMKMMHNRRAWRARK